MDEFVFPVRVYYEDTDAGGVVYYANYLKFMERARTEWLRHLGFSHSVMHSHYQIMFVMKELAINYRKPARLDDALTIHSHLQAHNKASLTLQQKVQQDAVVLCEGVAKLACVHTETFRPTMIPTDILAKFCYDV